MAALRLVLVLYYMGVAYGYCRELVSRYEMDQLLFIINIIHCCHIIE